MSLNIPNLDCMDAKELRVIGSRLDTLSRYAILKAIAMEWRKEGKVEQALRTERALDDLYKKLPQDWRW